LLTHPPLPLSPLCISMCTVHVSAIHQWWATPSELLPWDCHQTMTSVLVWDTGWPNGDQCHLLVPVGSVVQSTADTCLAAAITCPHYGPNTTTSLSMEQGYSYSAYKSKWMALGMCYTINLFCFMMALCSNHYSCNAIDFLFHHFILHHFSSIKLWWSNQLDRP